MTGKRKLKVVFTALLFILCIAVTSWWAYISFTFVPFGPLALNDKKELVPAKVPDDFYKNLVFVLDGCHITHTIDILNHPLIPLKVASDKELILDLTEKSQDIVWLYNHTEKKGSSFPCRGQGYEGFVLKNERPYFIGGDNAVDVDLTCGEIAIAEQILCTQAEEAEGVKAWGIEFELPDYYRQYIGYRNTKGEIIVYISFSHRDVTTISQIWHHLHIVEDGGSFYWKVEVNLNQKAISHLSVNGFA